MIRRFDSFQNDDDVNEFQDSVQKLEIGGGTATVIKTEISQQLRRPIAFLGMSNGIFSMGNRIAAVKFVNENGELMEDELDQIRKRIELGYGLNSQDNLKLFQNKVNKIEQEIEFDNDDFNLFTELHDFWDWIQKCINYKKEQNNNNLQGGFKWKNMVDPSTGFKNIIEVEKEQNILPKPNNYLIFGHHVCETDKRIQALNICGWQELYVLQNNRYENQQNSPEKKLTAYLDRLVQDGQMSKAVAIAVFHFDFSKAYEYLNKIETGYDPHALSFMKYILKGLDNIQSILEKDQNLKNLFYQKKDNKQNEVQIGRAADCKTDWETLKKVNIFHESFQTEFLGKLQEKQINIQFSYFLSNIMPFIQSMCSSTNFRDPYFKAICNFISNDQNHILYELRIPQFDRLAFAIRFYDSKKLENLFQNYEEASKSKGILGSLILTGQSQSSVEILQKYLDIKSDIQTVGLASVYLRIFKVIGEKKQQEWYSNYQGLLNKLRLFGERVKLDKQYSRLMETFLPNEGKLKDSLQSPFVIQKCNFCQCKNDHQSLLQKLTNKPYQTGSQPLQLRVESTLEKALLFNCQKCHKPFPNCASCLLPITVSNVFSENTSQNELEESVIWCQTCKHGGHYRHIVEWFKEYNICPVSDCICECALL